ncbi:hypothetical protein [Mucilaginibacter sp.]|uniref:hypothetical protein n=1 Tax=Mucilaginibacter sp. TaxID=1882438 RepID=UPI0032670C14
MGFLKDRLFCVLNTYLGVALLLMSSCDNTDFVKFEGPDISYQIYAGQNEIVRIVRREENGPYSLQLFNQNGRLMRDVTMATPFPFRFIRCNNDSLTISYSVGQSDLELFLPWLKSNKFNPTEFGRYKIAYSYTIIGGKIERVNKNIDYLSVDRRKGKAKLFLQNKLVDEVAIETLGIYGSRLKYLSLHADTAITYNLIDSMVVRKYLHDIVSSYK